VGLDYLKLSLLSNLTFVSATEEDLGAAICVCFGEVAERSSDEAVHADDHDADGVGCGRDDGELVAVLAN
jgi:hypothetical protein